MEIGLFRTINLLYNYGIYKALIDSRGSIIMRIDGSSQSNIEQISSGKRINSASDDAADHGL